MSHIDKPGLDTPACATPGDGGGGVGPTHNGAPEAAPHHSGQAPVVDSASLLQGQRELFIQHQGQRYRLQATRQGKLILTK